MWASAFRTDDDASQYERDNVARTGALLEAALGAGVGRFVLMSSGSVYAPGTPSPIPEDAPTGPITAYAHSKLAAEELAWRSRRRGLGATVVRGSLMYGPGDRHFRPLMDRVMRLPLVPLPGDGRALHDSCMSRTWPRCSSLPRAPRLRKAAPTTSAPVDRCRFARSPAGCGRSLATDHGW